ncbi:MAG: hypothetical protein JST78_10505 [Bacteroidetes bacterium]|nr:hypothetical protein [Bacteroidota bacterium]
MKTAKKAYIQFGSFQSPIKVDGLQPIHCFITKNKKRVVEIHSLQKALGYEGKSELWLLNLLISLSKFKEIPEHLLQAYNHPKNIEIKKHGAEGRQIQVVSHKIMSQTFEILMSAKIEGLLNASQIKYGKNAEVFVKQTHGQSIKKIINEVSGLNHFRKRNKLLIQNKLLEKKEEPMFYWISHLPNSFFEKVMKLERQTWENIESKTEIIIHLFYKIFSTHLPNDIRELSLNKKPKRIYQKKFTQPKNQIFEALNDYLEQILVLIKQSAGDRFIFDQLLHRSYPPTTNEVYLDTKADKKSEIILSDFNQILKKLVK